MCSIGVNVQVVDSDNSRSSTGSGSHSRILFVARTICTLLVGALFSAVLYYFSLYVCTFARCVCVFNVQHLYINNSMTQLQGRVQGVRGGIQGVIQGDQRF
jgi:hypothetical protein